jgi:hypothetical protein
MTPEQRQLDTALLRLHEARESEKSHRWCLSLWSKFVRLRDGGRCVNCSSPDGIAAHHIVRKCVLTEASLQVGNGITLCRICHKDPHEMFNRRPDFDLPMDAQGGEKIDLMTCYFYLLLADARERGLLCDRFYFLSDGVLQTFKGLEEYESVDFPGTRVERAYLIWRQGSRRLRDAILRANGLAFPKDFILTNGVTTFNMEGGEIGVHISI